MVSQEATPYASVQYIGGWKELETIGVEWKSEVVDIFRVRAAGTRKVADVERKISTSANQAW
jgi:hypothetical protein